MTEQSQSIDMPTHGTEYRTDGLLGERRNVVCNDRVDQVFIQTAYLKTRFPSLCLYQMPVPSAILK